jgi:peptidoglycan-associated lipoprotein
LALGNKRAVAVARALKAYGAADRQMKITSVGNYEPKAKGHAEASWSKNRRVDLIYPAM